MTTGSSSTPDVRQRLQSLSIPKDQRPTARGSSRSLGWIVRLVILAAVVATGYAAWSRRDALADMLPKGGDKAGAAPIPTMIVRAQTEQSSPPVLTATGKIVSDHRVQVVTKVSGQIVELHFEQGDRVAAGQVLARIEDVNYRARRDEAAAMLEKARTSLTYQEFEFARTMKMAGSGSATDKEIASVKRAIDEARAQVAADTASLEWFSKALKDTEIVAPIAGVILERNVEIGDFVAAEGGRGMVANAQFASIADMNKLRVEIDISELDVARVAKDMKCVITPDAYKDRRYTGRVLWIDPGANYAKATVQAKVRIDNPDEFLRVEGSAQVQFRADDTAASAEEAGATTRAETIATEGGATTRAATSATEGGATTRAAAGATVRRVWLPTAAVRTGDKSGQPQVFVVQDGRARAVPVTLGRTMSGQVEVISGLSDGQTIISGELDRVTDGMRL